MIATAPLFDTDFLRQFDALIGWRRDVRLFRTDPLDEALVEALLETAQHAPSVGNSQPWRFVRVKNLALREALATHVDGEVARAGKAYTDAERRDLYGRLKLHGLREAPEVMAVFCDEGTAIGGGLGAATMPEARAYSVVLAIHTLWLAARARDVALGWVSILDPAYVATLLDVPAGWRMVALLCLGRAEAPSDVPELELRGWQARLDWRDNVSVR